MKQQFSNVLSLVDSKAVKSVLNSSQWDYDFRNNAIKSEQTITPREIRSIFNKLERMPFVEEEVRERIDQAKTSKDFDKYYNEVHCYDDEDDELDIADLIDNVNYWFAQFIAGDMAASLIPSEYSHVLETYNFFIK